MKIFLLYYLDGDIGEGGYYETVFQKAFLSQGNAHNFMKNNPPSGGDWSLITVETED